MTTNVEALKLLYVALGGKATDVADVNTIADMIVKIASAVGSTIELPAVSGADNGNVLTVVDGKWAKAAAPKELPAVSDTDDGNVLTVVSGEWAKAAVPSDLPAVTAEDNGSVLKVVDGVWAVGTDAITA